MILLAQQRNGVRELFPEKLERSVGRGERLEDVERHEQCTGVRLVLVGQRDHHELVTGPDVQIVHLHRELTKHMTDVDVQLI